MIRWKYQNRDELYHHGIKGQKWGVRRYQNKDGSLTSAGKVKKAKINYKYDQLHEGKAHKKYYNKDGTLNQKGYIKKAKLEDKYGKLTNGEKIKSTSTSNHGSNKAKTLQDMSNKEIQDKIERLRLEKTLKELQPEKVSMGKQFVDKYGDKIANRMIDYGSATAKKIVENKLSDALGIEPDEIKKLKREVDVLDLKVKKKQNEDKLNGDDGASQSEKWKKEAQDYENRKKIDEGQQRFREGKYAEDSVSDKITKNESGSSAPKHDTPSHTPDTSSHKPASDSTPSVSTTSGKTKMQRAKELASNAKSPSRAIKDYHAKKVFEEGRQQIDVQKKANRAMAVQAAREARKVTSNPNATKAEKEAARRNARTYYQHYKNTEKNVKGQYERIANEATVRQSVRDIRAIRKAERKKKNTYRMD